MLGKWECGEEVGVGAVAGEGVGPGGAPGEDDCGGDGDVEGGSVRLAVVVIVDDEGAEEVTGRGEGRNGVAVLLAGGDREEAEGFLMVVAEMERLRDDCGGAAAEVAVGEPCCIECVGVVCWTAAVDVV